MENRDFKSLFGSVAKAHGFAAANGVWYRETAVALLVLHLQKSNYGNYFDLNIKLFLGCTRSTSPVAFKSLVKSHSGDVFRRQPPAYRDVFDLDTEVSAVDRSESLDRMFTELVDRIAAACSTSEGLLRLRDEGVLFLLPGVEARIKSA